MKAAQAATEQQLKDVFAVRQEVFVREQGVPQDEEYDEHDSTASHVILYDGDTPIGAGRTRAVDNEIGKMERVCVLAPHRGSGAGKLIMAELEAAAKRKGLQKAKLHAQTHAEGFYKHLGYETVSDVFLEAGIPHVVMVKEL